MPRHSIVDLSRIRSGHGPTALWSADAPKLAASKGVIANDRDLSEDLFAVHKPHHLALMLGPAPLLAWARRFAVLL